MIAATDCKVKCLKCKRHLPREAFNRNAARGNGLQCWCRRCHNPLCRKKRTAKDDAMLIQRALLCYYLSMQDGILKPKKDAKGKARFNVRSEMRFVMKLMEEYQ